VVVGGLIERIVVGVTAAAVLAGVVGAPAASGEALSAWWGLTSGSRPTNLVVGEVGQIVVTAQNRGDASTSGEVTISDQLPAGLEAIGINGLAGETGPGNRGPVSCTLATLTCAFSGSLRPYEEIEMVISVSVKAGAWSGEQNTATVSGGAAASPVTASHEIEVNGREKFGVEDYELIPENAGGSVDTQAGSHPFQLTSVVTLNTKTPDQQGRPRTVALPMDIVSELPPGVIANPTPFAQCTDGQFNQKVIEEEQPINECPAQSAIGMATMTFNEPHTLGFDTVTTPIFNMTPQVGEPARFAIKAAGLISAFLGTSIRSGADYGVTLTSANIPEIAWLLSLKLTFWGVPGDPRHDHQRGWDCLKELGPPGACPATNATSPPQFVVMPTSCQAPFQSTLRGDSWGSSARPEEHAEPLAYNLRGGLGAPLPLDGCNHLPFAPRVTVTSDDAASTPTGLSVGLHIPQGASTLPAERLNHGSESLAESSVKDITIALPEGVALNPAGANGLGACSEAQFGQSCPNAAKIGTVKLQTPILPNPLEGAVYLAAQNANPFGSLVAMYIVAEDPTSGTLVKLPGDVSLDQRTGQITVTFLNSPQLPFEDIELHFFGGERALLATPAHCGSYTTNASFVPWSGNEPVYSSSTFNITSGPNGGSGGSGCPSSSLPFAPSLKAGTTNIQAGVYSPLTVTVGREDGQRPLQGLELRLPRGVSGMLSGVPLCPEAQANAGACGPASQIGETTVSAGLGSDPYTVGGGKVYLTAGYQGAPFGLSIVSPVKAGPLDLENAPENHPSCDCLVIRARIEVDPRTAQLTITTDTEGPYKMPTILDGMPLQVRYLNITIDRPNFIFNPTNCNPMAIASTVSSGEGASAPVSVPFQVANCTALGFQPQFEVSTSGKTSRRNGASLHVKLVYPNAPFGRSEIGREANLASVKVDLPKQLVSRLATLEGACLASVFDQNPAACPATSRVGTASATTPVLPVPLRGPAYFVSHGGKKFPELIVVLQGDGVTIDLNGEMFINNAGITSSTFRTIPDVLVKTFELNLPEGSNSALAANGDLCAVGRTVLVRKRVKVRSGGHVRTVTRRVRKRTGGIVMPTAFTAQNGAVIHQNTPISVTGCPHARARARARKTRGS